MPVSKRPTAAPVEPPAAPQRRPTLAELVALRKALPPLPPDAGRASLADRFLLPPFSVLNAREGWWQKRKRMWIELGIQSELGRGELANDRAESGSARINDAGEAQRAYRGANAGMQDSAEELRIDAYRRNAKTNATPTGRAFPAAQIRSGDECGTPNEKYARGDGRGRAMAQTFGSGRPGDLAAGFRERGTDRLAPGGTGANSAWMSRTGDGYRSRKELDRETASLVGGCPFGTTVHPYDGGESEAAQSGTSIFDPVLCEIAYRWFCPAGGRIIDPFAGGSVRGIVAAKLGRPYRGVDLRPEQAQANELQRDTICPDADLEWVVGDALHVRTLCPHGDGYDLVFSCPPYADLERYSDDPRDLSAMDYGAFLGAYNEIIARTCSLLKEDRFAVWVIGDVRDRATGNYRGLVGDTVAAFRAAGLELYNQAILVTAAGSLPIRVGKQFAGYRKLGNTHQHVLVFLKGDAGRASRACGSVETDFLAMPAPAPGRIAVCAQDCAGLASEGYYDGDGTDVPVLDLPQTEACLLADIIRGEARMAGRAAPRVWIGGKEAWERVSDAEELTYMIGDAPYLNPTLFPAAPRPVDTPPPPIQLRD